MFNLIYNCILRCNMQASCELQCVSRKQFCKSCSGISSVICTLKLGLKFSVHITLAIVDIKWWSCIILELINFIYHQCTYCTGTSTSTNICKNTLVLVQHAHYFNLSIMRCSSYGPQVQYNWVLCTIAAQQ